MTTRHDTFVPPPAPPASPRAVWSRLLLLAVGVAVGASLGLVAGRALKHSAGSGLMARGDLLWLPLAWLLAVAVHEAGHLAFGALAGLRPVLYVVGPLRVRRDGARFRVEFNDNLATWGGIAAAVPPDSERFVSRMMQLVLGGPVASVLLALACAAVVAALGIAHSMFFAITCGMSALIAIATLLPVNGGGFMSDGAQLLAYARGGGDVELRGVLLSLAGASMAGMRPRDLDPALVRRGLALEGKPLARVALLSIAACAAVDRGEDAGPHFAELASRFHEYPDGFRQSIALWLAWYTASELRDLDLARAWLERGRGGIVDGAQRELAEAAVATIAGDAAAAGAAIAKARTRGAGMDPGTDQLVRDLLRRLEGAGA